MNLGIILERVRRMTSLNLCFEKSLSSFIACAVSIVSMLLVPPVYGLEPGCYSHDDFKKLGEIGKADRILMCHTLDEIDIGIGKTIRTGEPKVVVGQEPIYFSRDELETFLEHQKHKDLLCVWLMKSMQVPPKEAEESINEMVSFVDRLGYKRVLILGCRAQGFVVFKDMVYEVASSNPGDGQGPDLYLKVAEGQGPLSLIIDGLASNRKFQLEELENFFETESHKDSVRLYLPKWAQGQVKENLSHSLMRFGYKHVAFDEARGMFQVEPIVVDERHYSTGRREKHHSTSKSQKSRRNDGGK